jgi:hypothetical protein
VAGAAAGLKVDRRPGECTSPRSALS